MLSLIGSIVQMILAWLPLQLVRALRKRQLRKGGVVEITLSASSRRAPSARAQGLLTALALADDPLVHGVLFRLNSLEPGWARLQDVREVIEALHAAGKRTALYLEQGSNAELYLASAADRVWAPPVADLFLTGIGGRLSFLGNVLARAGVQADMEAAGTYKSFGEPFTRSFASPANREQLQVLFTDLQEQLIAGICEGRGLSREAVEALMAASPLSAEAAQSAGLLDDLIYSDQLEGHLAKLLEVASVRPLRWKRYTWLRRLEQWLAGLGQPRKQIAVVHLEGAIIIGADTPSGRRIESRSVVPVIDKLTEDDSIQAVVLRVDSGGGSAVASDLIARAVQRLGQRKPVVAVYGNVSASGGYYLSVPAHELIARPGTITGSIGVIGGKLVVSEALSRHGFTGDFVDVGPDVGFFGPFRPFTPEQRARFRVYLARTYDTFLRIVAGGRRCPVEAVEAVAGGRVWTGRQAKENGLIDHLGGLTTAIRRARLLSGLDDAAGQVVHIDFAPSRLKTLTTLTGLAQLDAADLAMALGGPHTELLRMMRQDPGRALALMPWVLED